MSTVRWTSPPLMAAMRKRRMAGAVAMAISPSRTTIAEGGSETTVMVMAPCCMTGRPARSRPRVPKSLRYRECMTAWSNLPPALPPHGTVLAWARGCRCDECEPEYQRFVSELALRGPLRLPAQPEPRKLDADTLARLE